MPEPKEALWRLAAGESLTREETEDLFGALMDGMVSDPIKAALLVALSIMATAPGFALVNVGAALLAFLTPVLTPAAGALCLLAGYRRP